MFFLNQLQLLKKSDNNRSSNYYRLAHKLTFLKEGIMKIYSCSIFLIFLSFALSACSRSAASEISMQQGPSGLLDYHKAIFRNGALEIIEMKSFAGNILKHRRAIISSESAARDLLRKKYPKSVNFDSAKIQRVISRMNTVQNELIKEKLNESIAQSIVNLQFESDFIIQNRLASDSSGIDEIRFQDLQTITQLEAFYAPGEEIPSIFSKVRQAFNLDLKTDFDDLKESQSAIDKDPELKRLSTAYNQLIDTYSFTVARVVSKKFIKDTDIVFSDDRGVIFGFTPAQGKLEDFYPSNKNSLLKKHPKPLPTRKDRKNDSVYTAHPSITGGFKDDVLVLERFGLFLDKEPIGNINHLLETYTSQISKSLVKDLRILLRDRYLFIAVEKFLESKGIFQEAGYGRYTPRPLVIRVGKSLPKAEIDNRDTSEKNLETLYHEVIHYIFDQEDSLLAEWPSAGGLDHLAIGILEMRWQIIRSVKLGKFNVPSLSVISNDLNKTIKEQLAEERIDDKFLKRFDSEEFMNMLVFNQIHNALSHNRFIDLGLGDENKLSDEQLQDLAYLARINVLLLRTMVHKLMGNAQTGQPLLSLLKSPAVKKEIISDYNRSLRQGVYDWLR